MTQLAVQTHTLRNLDVDVETKLDRIAAAGYEGVQFTPGLEDTPPGELADLLADRGLAVAGCHISTTQIEEEYEATVDTYRAIGATELVIPSYGRDGFESEAAANAAGEDVNESSIRFAEDGFALHYHNHSYEFEPLNGETAFDVFAAATEGHLALEIDTGLAYRGDADPVDLLERYADRVDLVHLTDTIPGDNATAHIDLGEGEVDLPACIAATLDADASWLIYENGRTDEPFASIEAAAEYVEEYR